MSAFLSVSLAGSRQIPYMVFDDSLVTGRWVGVSRNHHDHGTDLLGAAVGCFSLRTVHVYQDRNSIRSAPPQSCACLACCDESLMLAKV